MAVTLKGQGELRTERTRELRWFLEYCKNERVYRHIVAVPYMMGEF